MKLHAGVVVILVSSLVLLAKEASAQGLPGSRPNILVVMADDLDVNAMQVLLEQDLMPNLERYVVGAGTSFEESFVTNSICCPSRATYLTGQYTHNHRTLSNAFLNGAVLSFDDANTLGTWLQAAGYRTAHVGKYLNGYGIADSLKDPGLLNLARFLIARLYPETADRVEPGYIPPGWDSWYGLVDISTYCVFDYKMNENGRIRAYLRDGSILEDGIVVREGNGGTEENYQTDVLADKAAAFLEDHWARGDAKPFFLSVTPLAPHVESCAGQDPELPDTDLLTYKDSFRTIIRPAPRHRAWVDALAVTAATLLPARPSFNEPDLEDKPQLLESRLEVLLPEEQDDVFRQFGHRAASMMAVDDLLGRLIQMIEARGEMDSTFILFTSDNGWFSGEHRLSSKALAYEEAIRVPLFIRLPGQLEPREEHRVVLNNDIAPTLLELADAAPTIEVDGRSLLPLLDGAPVPTWRSRFVVEHYSGYGPGARLRPSDPFNLFGIRTAASSSLPNRTYIEYYVGTQYRDEYRRVLWSPRKEGSLWQDPPWARELYAMDEDPYQTDNLLYRTGSRPDPRRIRDEAKTLQSWMLELLSCAGAECRALENP